MTFIQSSGSQPPGTYSLSQTDVLPDVPSTELERIYTVNSSSAVVTVKLPATVPHDGFKFNIKRVGTNNVVIDANNSGQANPKIDADNTKTLSVNYSSITLVSDGTDYRII